ncbi:MAG TPA: efflux RND transporter periplasmic adaptor subunit [Thermoanaerobaculia bacterium]|jgi:membrane fusion protein (multidrug efflux system)|nr:efflux RND transporter periplasmic adaptor subunit [Thermoanaerobaculia bacterium]
MKKRMILTVVAMVVFLTAIGSLKFFQIRAAIAQSMSFRPPPEAVTTTVARTEQWPATLSAVGSVVAVQGVTVSADLPGVVEAIAFDSGARVRKGDLLVRLDTSQEQAQLAAAVAERRLAALNLERMRALRGKGVVSQAEYDRIQAESQQAGARAAEIAATIERKRIRAPFAGTLGIRRVNLGQYLDAGAAVVPLQAIDPIYVSFGVPQQDAGRLPAGAEVRVTAEVGGLATTGRITAVDSVVDEATRNVQVQATFDNPQGALHPGMFVTASVQLGAGQPVVSLPASAINYAPYGDSVYVVEEVKGPGGESYLGVRQQIVKLGPARGDQVAVLSGIKAGEQVVTSGVFKLRPGAAVQVNNKIQPANNPAPQPENS